jgi:serine/threonine-protein kinase
MDSKRLELTGPAVPVLEDVANRNANGFAHIAFTNSGTMVYIAGSNSATQQTMSWMDAAGKLQPLSAPPSNAYANPRISPDGTRVAVVVQDATGNNLVSYEPAQNRMTRLTFFQRISNNSPVWTPDGRHIVFELLSSELSGPGIYWMRSDGAGAAQQLVAGQNLVGYSFSPDGKRLAYWGLSGSDYGIWTLPLDLADPEHPKAGKPELFLASKSPLLSPVFSPDGHWIAYNPGGGSGEIFVRPFPGPSGQWQVSNTGGMTPVWSRDGRNLFYRGGRGATEIMVAAYSARGDSFEAGQPRPWSEKPLPVADYGFDIAPDGKRALVVTFVSGASTADRQSQVAFLLNFADELRRKVPAGK